MFWTDQEPKLGPFREQRCVHGHLHHAQADIPEHAGAEFPMVNIWNGPEAYVLTAAIPGVEPEGLDVAVVGDTVTIRGSRAPRTLVEGEAYHRVERGYGQFVRSVKLPKRLNPDQVEARYSKGILNLRLPRAEAEMPRKIALKST
jgi:HSP20 family protein